MPSPHRAFVTRSPAVAHELRNRCGVSAPDGRSRPAFFDAIWDTGATNSGISDRVVEACGLAPVSFGSVRTTHDVKEDVPLYMITFHLPGEVNVTNVLVAGGCEDDILIGMDIITLGDFAVTTFEGSTRFTFRYPSQGHIDFVEEAEREEKRQANTEKRRQQSGLSRRRGGRRGSGLDPAG